MSRRPSRRWSPADDEAGRAGARAREMRRRRNNEMSDKGRSAKTLRRRLLPYGLLAPGVIWLVVFFVVPMYFMGEMSLRSGVPNTPEGFTFSWEFSNYTDALAGRGEQIVRTFYLRGNGDDHRPVDRLPARVRDRAQGQPPLAPAAALRGDRPLLHHLPDQDGRLGDDPRRRQPDRGHPQVAPDHPGRRPSAGHLRRRHRRPHLQLPPLHDPADLRQPGADRHEPDRGGQGPLRLGETGLSSSHLAPDHARRHRGCIADLHSGVRAITSTRSSSAAPTTR